MSEGVGYIGVGCGGCGMGVGNARPPKTITVHQWFRIFFFVYSIALKTTQEHSKIPQTSSGKSQSFLLHMHSVPPMSVLFELALALFELRLKLAYRLRTPCINLNPLRPPEPPELHLHLPH